MKSQSYLKYEIVISSFFYPTINNLKTVNILRFHNLPSFNKFIYFLNENQTFQKLFKNVTYQMGPNPLLLQVDSGLTMQ